MVLQTAINQLRLAGRKLVRFHDPFPEIATKFYLLREGKSKCFFQNQV